MTWGPALSGAGFHLPKWVTWFSLTLPRLTAAPELYTASLAGYSRCCHSHLYLLSQPRVFLPQANPIVPCAQAASQSLCFYTEHCLCVLFFVLPISVQILLFFKIQPKASSSTVPNLIPPRSIISLVGASSLPCVSVSLFYYIIY